MLNSIKVAVGAALLLASVQTARADIIYNLSNVTLSSLPSGGTPSGTLTGSFTTNNARTALVTYNIFASAFGSFLGFNYTPVTAPVSAATLPQQYFQLDAPGGSAELRLYFTSALTTAGATLLTASSYENELSGGNRFASGTVAAAAATVVPEPASLALLGVGVGGLAALRRRRAA